MDERILDPESARERLAAWKGRIDKLAADTQAMSDQLQGLRITAADPQGLSEVTIDSTGALVGLKLTDRIERVTPDTVAQTIMATLADARNKLADRSQEIIVDTVGTESAAARAIAENVGRQLRTGPAAEPVAVHDDTDEDYGTHSHVEEKW